MRESKTASLKVVCGSLFIVLNVHFQHCLYSGSLSSHGSSSKDRRVLSDSSSQAVPTTEPFFTVRRQIVNQLQSIHCSICSLINFCQKLLLVIRGPGLVLSLLEMLSKGEQNTFVSTRSSRRERTRRDKLYFARVRGISCKGRTEPVSGLNGSWVLARRCNIQGS